MYVPFVGNLFAKPSKENPDVPLTADVIYGSTNPLANTDTTSTAGALYCSAVFSAERFLTDALATLPLITYDRTTLERAKVPAAHVLHDRPNEFQTPYIFWQTAWRKAIRTGNAYIFTEYDNGGRLANLVLLDGAKVKVEFLNGTKTYTYTYDSQYRLGTDQIIHLLGFTENGLTGMPLLAYAANAVGASLVAEQYAIEFFTKSDNAPGYIELANPNATEAQVRQIRAAFEAQRKAKGSQSYPIIPGGKLVKTGYDNQQSQMLESRQFQLAEVARFLRIPPHILYHYATGGGTYANLEAQNIDLVTSCLQPFITQWEQEVTRCIYGTDSTYYVEALIDARLRGDTKTRYDAYAVALDKGFMTVAEVRKRENLPPLPEPPAAPVAPQPVQPMPQTMPHEGGDNGAA